VATAASAGRPELQVLARRSQSPAACSPRVLTSRDVVWNGCSRVQATVVPPTGHATPVMFAPPVREATETGVAPPLQQGAGGPPRECSPGMLRREGTEPPGGTTVASSVVRGGSMTMGVPMQQALVTRKQFDTGAVKSPIVPVWQPMRAPPPMAVITACPVGATSSTSAAAGMRVPAPGVAATPPSAAVPPAAAAPPAAVAASVQVPTGPAAPPTAAVPAAAKASVPAAARHTPSQENRGQQLRSASGTRRRFLI